MDVEHFNRVANHESVRPRIGGDGPMELKPVIDNLANYAFKTEHGGFILLDCGSGRFDVHSIFLPEGRGKEAYDAMANVAEYMFTRTGCVEGRTTIAAEGNAGGALALAKRGGFEQRFDLEKMPWKAGTTTKAVFMALTLEKWALTSPTALEAGRWFHSKLEAEKVASGSAAHVHPEETVHDRMVGAALLMVHGGQPEKAVAFYNVWALMSGYAPIALLTKRPVVIDVVDAIIEATADDMEILRCR